MSDFQYWFKRVASVVLQVVVAVALVVVVAALMAKEAGQPAGLLDVLKLVAGSGLSAAVISTILTRLEWFKALTGDNKHLVVSLFALGLPILAQALVAVVPPDYWPVIESYWPYVLSSAAFYLGGTAWYKLVMKRE